MPNISLWLGLIAAGGVLSWSLFQQGVARNILNAHGLLIVLGGTAAAMLINTPAAQLFTALRTLLWIMAPAGLPSRPEVAAEVIRLSHKARAEGGLLALRDESPDFAGGFLRRALETAAACSETSAAREILEGEIRNRRLARQEDANVFRTIGTLAPMFGLLGTLLGMLQVLTAMSDPAKLGPAMALALSSAFIGIGTANFLCIPIAGQIRLLAMRQTLLLEMILEGALDIAVNRPVYQVEMRMASYLASPVASTARQE
ncbi:MAG: MotA/TolQ/ExbB proton channel family protein [Elusimicrobiota bacterium]